MNGNRQTRRLQISKVASATSGSYDVSPPSVFLTRRATSPLGKTTVISGGTIDVDKSFESSIWHACAWEWCVRVGEGVYGVGVRVRVWACGCGCVVPPRR